MQRCSSVMGSPYAGEYMDGRVDEGHPAVTRASLLSPGSSYPESASISAASSGSTSIKDPAKDCLAFSASPRLTPGPIRTTVGSQSLVASETTDYDEGRRHG